VLGLSDAGAHASQLCDACFSTHLLSHWTREKGVLSLEQAVWRLTGQPAQIFGIADRGVVKEGLAADLVAFDPDTVGVTALEAVPSRRLRPQRFPDGLVARVLVRPHLGHALPRPADAS